MPSMADADLLERAQEAIDEDTLPEILIADPQQAEKVREFNAQARGIIEQSREWISGLNEIIAGVRAHADADPLETWRELAPLISSRISRREHHIGQLEDVRLKMRQLKDNGS